MTELSLHGCYPSCCPSSRREWKLMDAIIVLCLFCVVWILITTFAPVPIGGLASSSEVAKFGVTSSCKDISYCICPRDTCCADSLAALVLFSVSRVSAYFSYPLIMLMFLSKANNLITVLQNSVLSIWVDFIELHQLHASGGTIIGVTSLIHSVFHLIRWGIGGDISLLWTSQTGITGFIAFGITPFIICPMRYPGLFRLLSYEWRKMMHNLSLLWGIALMFHAPMMHIFWLVGIPIAIYILDWIIGLFGKTYRVESTHFRRLENACAMHFANPEGFKVDSSSYILVLLPWVSKYEWHAFSVFPHPTEASTSSVCIAVLGDWTSNLHTKLERPTSRPAWIQGPFSQTHQRAIDYDNIVSVTSGIGITPALSLMSLYGKNRRINLVWVCRDSSLVEYILTSMVSSTLTSPSAFILIYYTGNLQLKVPDLLPANVHVFSGRPNVEHVIVGLVYRLESGEMRIGEVVSDLEDLTKSASAATNSMNVVLRLLRLYSVDEIYNAALDVSKDALIKTNISLSGLHAAIFELSNKTCTDFTGVDLLFAYLTKNSNGEIDRSNFAQLISLLPRYNDSNLISDMQQPTTLVTGQPCARNAFFRTTRALTELEQIQIDNAVDFVQRECSKSDLATWQMIYCGGSCSILSLLKSIRKEYDIGLKIEEFDW